MYSSTVDPYWMCATTLIGTKYNIMPMVLYQNYKGVRALQSSCSEVLQGRFIVLHTVHYYRVICQTTEGILFFVINPTVILCGNGEKKVVLTLWKLEGRKESRLLINYIKIKMRVKSPVLCLISSMKTSLWRLEVLVNFYTVWQFWVKWV